MAGKEDYRIFVGGLSRNISERQLEGAFSRYGKVIETQIMLERDTGRPRGFGFITFSDRRGMDDAIREMHGQEFGDKIISVNKAQPRGGGEDDVDHGYKGGYSSGGRGSHGGGNRSTGQDECFKCGRSGHWARDCPSASGGRGGGRGSYTSRPRFGEDGRGERFGERSRFLNDRIDGGRFGDRDRFDSRDNKYGNHERYVGDSLSRYPSGGDRFGSNRYGDYDQYSNGYGKDRSYDRDGGGPRGGADRYGMGGPARDDGRSFKNRPGPYDRPSRGGRASSYERY